LKLLVDSCVPAAVTARLRLEGHDVYAAAEHPPDPGDLAILRRARAEARVILTIDSDFGALVFRDGEQRVGLIRLLARKAGDQAIRACELVMRFEAALSAGAFVTDDGDSARVNSPEP
jgi:predicted nuclease of predicted toxin-antitoxin system